MPEDYTIKRRELASLAIDASTKIVEGVQELLNMAHDLAQTGGGFEDGDFVGLVSLPDRRPTDLSHLNAWKMNTLINVVVPGLKMAAESPVGDGSSVTFENILYAVKRA